jgi:hypothetical protein
VSVSITDADGRPVSNFGSGNSAYSTGIQANNSLFTNFEGGPDANEMANAPGLKSPTTFGDEGSTTDAGAGRESTVGQAGNTASLGFGDLRNVKAPRRPGGGGGGGGGGGSSSGAATPKLLPGDMSGITKNPATFDPKSDKGSTPGTTTPGQGSTLGTAANGSAAEPTTSTPPPPSPSSSWAGATEHLNQQQFGGMDGGPATFGGSQSPTMSSTATGPSNFNAGNNAPPPPNGGSTDTEDV